jgi:putative MFS transporter
MDTQTDKPLGSPHIAARLDRLPTTRFHIKVASLLGVGTFFDGFDAISVAVVLPVIVSTFDISFAEAGLIISAGYLGQFVGALAIGALSDRIGRRPAFVICLAMFGLLSLACAFAWSSTSLLVFRLVQGLGLGAEVPVAATLMNEYLGRRNRGRIGVLYQSVFQWGFFLAPLVALILVSTAGPELGWRILLGIGALPLVMAVVAWVMLPESARWLASKGRMVEAERHVSLIERQATTHGRVLEEPEPAAEQLEGTRFRARELFLGVYGRRTAMLAVVWFSSYFVIYGFSVWLPSLYVSVGGLPQSASLLLTTIAGALGLASFYFIAAIIERVGRKPLLVGGLAITVAGAGFGAGATGIFGATAWPYLFTAGAIMTIGMTAPGAVLYLYTAELYPTRMRGFATSTASSFNRIASVISPILIGSLIGVAGGAGVIFTVLVIGAGVALVTIAVAGVETKGRRLEDISG